MRSLRGPLPLTLALLLPLLLASCAPRLGWGLLLWSQPEAGLHSGAVVPVYIRSNIEKLYVIGVPGGDKKAEVPLWQLELYPSRRAAEKARTAFGQYLTSYLVANRDGLPVRDAAAGTGNRVYRLREGQSVKVLASVQGEAVTTGSQVLEGAWFKVLTEDGTRGYVFTNTMRMYDELTESPIAASSGGETDAARKVDLVFSRVWRAEYFETMLDEGRVDLDLFNPRYGLFANSVARQIRIELPSISKVFNYSSIAESNGDFAFEGSDLVVRFSGDRRLEADWSGDVDSAAAVIEDSVKALAAASAAPGDEAPPPDPDGLALPAAGATKAVFVVLDADLREAIRAEETRRLNLLSDFAAKGSAWRLDALPEAALQAEGAAAPAATGPAPLLSVSRSGRFTWAGIAGVPASYLPSDLGLVEGGDAGGEAAIRLFLDPSLSGSWEGALSLRFDGTKGWLDLLYRHEGGKLVLLPVGPGGVRDLVAVAASPLQPLAFSPAR